MPTAVGPSSRKQRRGSRARTGQHFFRRPQKIQSSEFPEEKTQEETARKDWFVDLLELIKWKSHSEKEEGRSLPKAYLELQLMNDEDLSLSKTRLEKLTKEE
ncbi:hypothetical protein FRC01_004978, partial [Tulasnella sp. 417]